LPVANGNQQRTTGNQQLTTNNLTINGGNIMELTLKPIIVTSYALRVVAAIILLQTLFFKFTGAEESIRIFTTLGAEPWGRIGSGALELVAAILLLIPRTTAIGAILSMGAMAGAIFSHLTILGIDLSKTGMKDNGLLFALAVVTFLCSAAVLFIHRKEVPVIGHLL
jgi:uncharacterized membrane protein YphA (DoxX/SURF4 family)